MLIILAIALVNIALPVLTRLIVEAIAMAIAFQMLRSSRKIGDALIARRTYHRVHVAGWDARPCYAERRLLRRGLANALRLTELAGLFPKTVDRVRRFA